jgi:hypothetical protein
VNGGREKRIKTQLGVKCSKCGVEPYIWENVVEVERGKRANIQPGIICKVESCPWENVWPIASLRYRVWGNKSIPFVLVEGGRKMGTNVYPGTEYGAVFYARENIWPDVPPRYRVWSSRPLVLVLRLQINLLKMHPRNYGHRIPRWLAQESRYP